MFSYKIYIYEQNGWQVLDDVGLPITDGAVLDDTLDEGRIDLCNTTRSRAIRPFQRIKVECYENGVLAKTIQRVVGTAKRVRKRNTTPALYDWSIQTLELTKLLERDFIGSMTATKPLSKIYNDEYIDNAMPSIRYFKKASTLGAEWQEIPADESDITYTNIPTYKLGYYVGTILTFTNDWLDAGVNGVVGNTWVEEPTTKLLKNGNAIADNTLSTRGNYQIETTATCFSTSGNYYKIEVVWIISAFTDVETNKTFSIGNIVKRLLYAGVTRRWETQKYTLDTAFATKYAEVEAPEFAFTNSTLLDALFQIGGKIHAIPRLVCAEGNDLQYIVTFDELGGNEEVGDKMPQWAYEEQTIDINDYCDTLDSPAQNLVNSSNIDKGCISEFGDQFITIRTENTQVEISADTMAVRTAMPIKQMVKCEIVYDGTIYDITPYVYEVAEYNTLSTLYTSTYPYSKGYALCYSIGGDTITGLNNKQTTPTIIQGLDEQYAIINILNAVSGLSLESATFTDYINLAFRVTYVPIVTARVTQKRPIKSDTNGNTLVYNQGANMVETSAFGQKMRGAIARLGLETTRRTYDFDTFANLPEVGQKIDGEYIAQVDCAYYPTKVRATVLLTPNFNQLSQYVGLDTNYRLYDVSERQTVDRFINYNEIVEVGDNEYASTNTIMSVDLLKRTTIATIEHLGEVERVDTAMSVSYDQDGNEIENSAVLLPVASFPFGQSLAFVCSFVDNYGAGYQAVDKFDIDGKSKRVQRLVPYADNLGEIDKLALYYLNEQAWHNAEQIGDNKQSALYPQATDDTRTYYETHSPMNTGAYPFVLSKDSSEKIGITYQVHFQANRPSVIIGNGLTENCPLVNNEIGEKPYAYKFTHELNNLSTIDIAKEIAEGSATQISYSRYATANGIEYTPLGIAEGTKSWAFVDENNNIYFGENTTSAKPIFLTIKQGA
jgi:hypothetical protein